MCTAEKKRFPPVIFSKPLIIYSDVWSWPKNS